jgi:acyl-[acyl-carrier-protein]-phospholipid O-acyltransferase/long-chain-fatty-acid--[acyl-carrier-protein] ligase
MVPHLQIEEHLNRLLGSDEDGTLKAVVTAIPDEKKGERLAVLHVKIDKTPEELRKGLMDAGLPNIFLPSVDSFVEVPDLPVLGSGKLDLKAMKQLALDHIARKK